MALRTLLSLVLVVGGLAALLWFTDRRPPTATAVEIAALDGRSLAECKRMRWQIKHQQPIEITRGPDGQFGLTEPIVDLASRAFLRQILVAWDSARMVATEYKDDLADRRETGLDTPELAFVADWPDGHRIAIDIGAPGPLGTDRFLRREGRIWRGGDSLFESMRVNLDDLRERSVFRAMEPQCTELRVEQARAGGKREVLHLQRSGANEWRMQAPFVGRVEPGVGVQFVTAVVSLRADQFLPTIVRLPAGEPTIRITVRGAYGEEKLELWEDSGAAYGQLPGRSTWFQSDSRAYAAVFQNAVQSLRGKMLVPLQNLAQDLAEVVIDPGQGRGDRLHLVRDSGAADWRLVEPVAHAAHPSPCNELVSAINNLHAIEFADGKSTSDPEVGLGAGRLLVAVRGFEQKEATNIWLGAEALRGDLPLVYACRADEQGTVVLVPKPVLDQARQPWTAYCAREICRLTVPIERIEVRPHAGGETRVFRAVDGHWQCEGREGRRDEVGEFATEVLRDLRGRTAIDLRRHPFGEPHWQLSLQRANGDELVQLRAWDRGAETPVLVQPATQSAVGHEVGIADSNSLRGLWR